MTSTPTSPDIVQTSSLSEASSESPGLTSLSLLILRRTCGWQESGSGQSVAFYRKWDSGRAEIPISLRSIVTRTYGRCFMGETNLGTGSTQPLPDSKRWMHGARILTFNQLPSEASMEKCFNESRRSILSILSVANLRTMMADCVIPSAINHLAAN